jgi:SAM-dependent methyltransferase
MNRFLRGVVRAAAEAFDLPGPVLEVGSYRVAGQEQVADLRPFFPGRTYVGVDQRPGPGVDQVADVEALPQDDGWAGTVLAANTFEHVRHFWRAFAEVRRVLRRDGVLLVTVPFSFHIHEHPSDYWRFTPEALDLMLEDYPYRILGWQGPRKRPLHVWALAFGDDRPPPSQEQLCTYELLLRWHAREPLRWHKRLRYAVGRWLCGRGPFAPYLDRERWEIECRPLSSPPTPARCPDGRTTAPAPVDRGPPAR